MDPIVAIQLRNRLRFTKVRRLRRPKRWRHPRNAERGFERNIQAIQDFILAEIRRTVFPRLAGLVQAAKRGRGDSWSDDLEALGEQLKIRIRETAPSAMQAATAAATEIGAFNLHEWRSMVKDVLGVDLFTNEPWLRDELRSWSREAANLITTLEDEAISRVQVWTARGIRDGWRWEDIAKNIEDKTEASRWRARFIARDQTAKLNGALTQRRQTQAGVTHYIWRDSRDERVRGNPGGKYPNARPSHWSRNGERFAWADAPDGGHPGRDYNCRCTAEPDLRGLLEAFKS
jgi:SPP1 gp7 family putative phage head morphogenesis protein